MAETSPRKLVETRIAALYLLVMETQQSGDIKLYRSAELRRAAVRLYNAARDGKINRHGDDTWRGARWDLAEVHTLLRIGGETAMMQSDAP